jgi:hypothetical protein
VLSKSPGVPWGSVDGPWWLFSRPWLITIFAVAVVKDQLVFEMKAGEKVDEKEKNEMSLR